MTKNSFIAEVTFRGRIEKNSLVKSLVTADVTFSEASLHTKCKKVKSSTESYDQITKKTLASSVGDSIKHAIDFEISEKILITTEVDSQVNGVSKNTKDAVKKTNTK